MSYDPTEARAIGAEYSRLRKRLKTIEPKVKPLMRAAKAGGVDQGDIAAWFGVTREVVRRACMTDEEYAAFLADQRAARSRRKEANSQA